MLHICGQQHPRWREAFVRSEKAKNHKRVYHNLPGDAEKLKSFYTKDATVAYKLDAKKLGDAFTTVPVKGKLTETDLFKSWAVGLAPEFAEAFNAAYDAKAAKEPHTCHHRQSDGKPRTPSKKGYPTDSPFLFLHDKIY